MGNEKVLALDIIKKELDSLKDNKLRGLHFDTFGIEEITKD